MVRRRARIERTGWVVVAFLVSAWLVERFGADSLGLFVLLGCMPRGFYIGVAFALVLAAVATRAWRTVGVGVAAVALAVGPLGGFELTSGVTTATSARSVRVVQYNVNKWDAGADAIARSIEELSPDVACLEEAGAYRWLGHGNQHPDALRAALQGWHFVGQGELLIATKLELVSERILPLAPGPPARPLVEAVVRLAGSAGELSVIAVHLIPTMPMQTWSEDRGDAASGSLAEIAAARRAQAERVRDHVLSLHRPVVVCGDLNSPPGSPPIRAFDGTLDDAFRLRGTGFGFTAPIRLPQQRIDYVFVRGLDVKSIQVGDATTSDHYPLVADVTIR